ncbi:hypothetical protein Hanom_Chr04g00300621 [Helianthus anomalus]
MVFYGLIYLMPAGERFLVIYLLVQWHPRALDYALPPRELALMSSERERERQRSIS